MTELAEGQQVWAIPWPCLYEFLVIVTHRRIYSPPTPVKRALGQVDAWFESVMLHLLAESAPHWLTLRSLLANGRIVGAQIHDARVAALCQQHGVRELWSADRDFSRFRRACGREPLLGKEKP